jgi:hypothetical protein
VRQRTARVVTTASDEALIDAVAAKLEPAVVAAAVRGAVALLASGQVDTAARRTAIASELATIATRERRLLDALVDGDAAVAASIKGRLRDKLARRDARQVLRLVVGEGRFTCTPFDDARGRGFDVTGAGDYGSLFTIRDFHTRLARLRTIALTRSPAWPVRRQNSRARSIAPRWEK